VRRAVRAGRVVKRSLVRTALSHRICTGISWWRCGLLVAELAGAVDLAAADIAKTTRAIRDQPERALPLLGVINKPDAQGNLIKPCGDAR
jgi:hypothetical protein